MHVWRCRRCSNEKSCKLGSLYLNAKDMHLPTAFLCNKLPFSTDLFCQTACSAHMLLLYTTIHITGERTLQPCHIIPAARLLVVQLALSVSGNFAEPQQHAHAQMLKSNDGQNLQCLLRYSIKVRACKLHILACSCVVSVCCSCLEMFCLSAGQSLLADLELLFQKTRVVCRALCI